MKIVIFAERVANLMKSFKLGLLGGETKACKYVGAEGNTHRCLRKGHPSLQEIKVTGII